MPVQYTLFGQSATKNEIRDWRKTVRPGKLATVGLNSKPRRETGYVPADMLMMPTPLTDLEKRWLGRQVTVIPGWYDFYGRRPVNADGSDRYIGGREQFPARTGQVWCIGKHGYVWVATLTGDLLEVHTEALRK